jgi:endonuclease V-like protein UPF0215 family
MKQGSRFLGIDDGPREVEKLIGVSYRGTEFMEQVEVIDQEPDTGEATDKIVELYRLFKQDIAAILLDGISFNGFNIADVYEIADRTGIPVIAVTSNEPDKEAMRSGLEAAGLESDMINELPEVNRFENVFIQFSGIGEMEAEEVVDAATLQGNIPEAVRSAHLIGTALND